MWNARRRRGRFLRAPASGSAPRAAAAVADSTTSMRGPSPRTSPSRSALNGRHALVARAPRRANPVKATRENASVPPARTCIGASSRTRSSAWPRAWFPAAHAPASTHHASAEAELRRDVPSDLVGAGADEAPRPGRVPDRTSSGAHASSQQLSPIVVPIARPTSVPPRPACGERPTPGGRRKQSGASRPRLGSRFRARGHEPRSRSGTGSLTCRTIRPAPRPWCRREEPPRRSPRPPRPAGRRRGR